MIDVAFISGRLGNAFFREGDNCFTLSVDGCPQAVAALDIQALLCHGSEYTVVRSTTVAAVTETLAESVNQHNALFLLIVLLDISVSLSARVMAAQAAETLLDYSSVLSFVRNRLLTVPLPSEQRADRRSVMQVVGEFPAVAEVLHEVFESQPIIENVKYEWSKTLDDVGIDPATIDGYETELVNGDFFSGVVRAVRSKDLQQMNGEIVKFAMSSVIPNSRVVLTSFRSRVERVFWGAKNAPGVQGRLRLPALKEDIPQKRRDTGDLISDLLCAANEGVDAPARIGALEAKLRVDRQISAIREMIFAGKNSTAEKYLAELLQFQLGQGDREYAVMSLCSLTAICLDANQLDLADRLSEYAAKLGENDVVAHTIRAEVYKIRGRFQNALRAYEETIHRFPGSRYALNGHAEVLKELGDFRKAAEQYTYIKREFPDDPVAFNGEVSVLKAAGRFREALKTAILNTKRFPYDPVTRSVLGGCLTSVGKYDEAVKQYRNAVEYGSRDTHLLTAYAYALRSLGKYREALELLDKYGGKNALETGVANTKANVLRTVGEFDRALKIYSEILGKFPTYTPARFGTAAVKILLGQVSEAISDLPTANMESELDWIGFRTYALSYLSVGGADEAVQRLKWGIANCPWWGERIRMETALGFAQFKAGSSESISTLQHNLERLDDRAKQIRLIFLGAAQAQAGQQSLANVILTSVFSSRDSQLRLLNSAVVNFYYPSSGARPVDPESIYRQEMNLAMAA